MGNAEFIEKARSSKDEPGYSSPPVGTENFNIRISDDLLDKIRLKNQKSPQTRPAESNQQSKVSESEEAKERIHRDQDKVESTKAEYCQKMEKAMVECLLKKSAEDCSEVMEEYEKCLEQN